MTQFLPPALLALFQARPPIKYIAPIEKPKLPQYTGISKYTKLFEDPSKVDYSKFKQIETKDQIKERKRKEKHDKEQAKINAALESWDPQKNSKATGDAYKTLFVCRINFETTESKLKREFEDYGPIKRVRLIHDSDSGKPKGYAFIEFEKERDMKTAFKMADGRKVDQKRVLVDVERGRTVQNWRPRRFGVGKGATRAGGEELNQKWSGREPAIEDTDLERRREREENDKRPHPGDHSREHREHREHRDPRDRGGDRDHRREREKERPDRERSDRDRSDRDRPDRERDRDGDRDRERPAKRERERDDDEQREVKRERTDRSDRSDRDRSDRRR